MIISIITLLPYDNPHAVAVDIGIVMNPIPVRLKVIDFEVLAIITNGSNDFCTVVIVLYFSYFFLDLLFLSLNYVINFLRLLIWLLITSFNFFSSPRSSSIFFINGALGYNLPVLCSIYMVKIRQNLLRYKPLPVW